MSMSDLEEGLRLVDQAAHPRTFFVGPRTEELVATAEGALGLRFPATYRRFVLEKGAGSVRGVEFYGVTTTNFLNGNVPNGPWLTLDRRRAWKLPPSLLIIQHWNDGRDVALDAGQADSVDGEWPVVLWRPGVTQPGDPLERVAPDFGSFFLQQARQLLDKGDENYEGDDDDGD